MTILCTYICTYWSGCGLPWHPPWCDTALLWLVLSSHPALLSPPVSSSKLRNDNKNQKFTDYVRATIHVIELWCSDLKKSTLLTINALCWSKRLEVSIIGIHRLKYATVQNIFLQSVWLIWWRCCLWKTVTHAHVENLIAMYMAALSCSVHYIIVPCSS